PQMYVNFSGNSGSPSVQISIYNGELRLYSYDYSNNAGRMRNNNREVSFADKLSSHTSRREMRVFVDNKLGTADVLIDGVHVTKLGQQANERAPGFASQVNLYSYAYSGFPTVISDVWLGPWNGEVPRPGDGEDGAIFLANG